MTKASGSYNACVDVNCYFQDEYISCFEALRDKNECLKILKMEIEQMGGYNFKHVKIWFCDSFYKKKQSKKLLNQSESKNYR